MDELKTSFRIVKVLKQVLNTLKQNMRHEFGNMNITGPQGMLIGILSHYGEMKISNLSEKLGLSNSTVSGIVDRLEKQGLVERNRSKEDRRVIYVRVTPEFTSITKNHYEKIEKSIESMISGATEEELSTILKGLNTLENIITNHNKGED